MTIEELALFYFQKQNRPRFSQYYEMDRSTLSHHIVLVNTLDLVISICFPQSFNSGSCLKIYQQIQIDIEHKDMH
jgi:hypothetical protein